MSMAIDLLIDPFGARWTDMRRIAQAAEASGFAGVWTWDHLAGACHRAPHVLESWTVLSAIAASTSTIKLGPLVLNVANRDAGTLAVAAATLQEVSKGRLLLGLGAGGGQQTPYQLEQVALGRAVPNDRARRAAVIDTCETLRRVWSDRTYGFLPPSPAPPIVIGAFGPKMATLAGEVGDGINTQAHHPHLTELLDAARSAHAGSPRREQPFLSTAFAGFDARWLDANRMERTRLVRAGVDRLILLCDSTTATRDIENAGTMLR